jgi:hypothetical protein
MVLSLCLTVAITSPLFLCIEAKAKQPILPLRFLADPQIAMILFGFVLLTATNYARVSRIRGCGLKVDVLSPALSTCTTGFGWREDGLRFASFIGNRFAFQLLLGLAHESKSTITT